MSSIPRTVIAVLLFSGCGALSRCAPETSPDTRLQQEVEHLQKRTIPPDSHLMDRHIVATLGWVERADWEFETKLGVGTYNAWLADQLQPDFKIQQGASSSTRFSKHDQGDVEALTVATTPSVGALRVTVKFEMYPD